MALKSLAADNEIVSNTQNDVVSALAVPVSCFLPEIAAGAGATVAIGAVFTVRSSGIGSVAVLDIRGRKIASVSPRTALMFTALDADAESWAVASAPVGQNNVVELSGAGAPVDGTTGDNLAGPGSRYTDITGADLYIQTSLITTPVWKLVTRAA